MLIEINNDVCYICERLKEIDAGYKIFFNTKRKKFEVHNVNQIGNSFCLTIPFNIISGKILSLVKKTRIENVKNLLNEIETQNILLENRIRNENKIKNEYLIKKNLTNLKII